MRKLIPFNTSAFALFIISLAFTSFTYAQKRIRVTPVAQGAASNIQLAVVRPAGAAAFAPARTGHVLAAAADASNTVTGGVNAVTYCIAGSSDADNEKISNVTIGAINNSSSSTAGYEDFTNLSAVLSPGSSYPMQVTATNEYLGDEVMVYIDFNHDGDFDDAGETVATSLQGQQPFNLNIAIPAGAQGGSTVMRVRLSDATVDDYSPSPCGNADYGQVEDYTISIIAQPAITLFTPAAQVIGKTVTIKGVNFTGATAVSFGGVPAASFVVYSDSVILASLGAGATGDVVVTLPWATATLAGFTFTQKLPSIASFTPATGPAGTTVTITGTNFNNASAVTFGGVPATLFTIFSNTVITAVAGPGATGAISVTTPGGTATSTSVFMVTPPPSITSFSPLTAAVGATVTITGTGFTGATAVKFGSTAATSFTVHSDIEIVATVQAGGAGNIQVTTAAGTSTSTGVFALPLSIANINPASGAPGATITITGTGFTGATAIKFGNTPASSFTVNSDAKITAVVASGSTGSVTVTTPAGATSIGGFTFYAPGAYCVPTMDNLLNNNISNLSIGSIDHANDSFDGYLDFTSYSTNLIIGSTNDIQVLDGSDYRPGIDKSLVVFIDINHDGDFDDEGETVGVSGKNEYPFVFSVTIPANSISGATRMRVKFLSYNSTAAACTDEHNGQVQDFTVNLVAAPAPTITGVTPSSGTYGDTVIITGTNFYGVTAVNFGGTPAKTYNIVSATQVSAIVAEGTTGKITVTTSTGTATSRSTFTVLPLPAPVIQSFTPATAKTQSTITITGTNLRYASAVSFGGTAATSFTTVSDTQITAVVGDGASGDVKVTNRSGTGALAGFAFIAQQEPSITSFEPGYVKHGSVVTIYGHEFLGTTAVSFGGTASPYFKVVSDSVIAANVGNGAEGDVSVTTPLGTAIIGGLAFYVARSYCSFSPVRPFTGINSVSMGSINNNTTNSGAQLDFTWQVTTITTGAVNDLQVGAQQYADGLKVFIDLNRDGDFDDEGENVSSVTGYPLDCQFIVPAGTLPGPTRMRLVSYIPLDGENAGPCGNVSYGQAQDYAVIIKTAPVPFIFAFTPIAADKGATITLFGTGFTGASAVSFGGINAASFTVESDGKINAVLSQGASGSISVTTYGGTGTMPGFTYTGYCMAGRDYDGINPASPQINRVQLGDIDNASGDGGGYSDYRNLSTRLYAGSANNQLTLAVGGYDGNVVSVDVYIDFNHDGDFDDEGEGFSVAHDFENNLLPLNIPVPADAVTGNTRMRIKAVNVNEINNTNGGCGKMSNGEFEDYTLSIQPYPVVPVITAFTPAQATGGQTVTISGTGFDATTAVSFGGTGAASFTVVSDTLITALVATGSTGNVSVINPVNSGSLPGFTFIPNAVPVITSFTPTSADQGAVITIKGSGFAYVSEVWFGAKAAASFTVISDTEITATLAQGSTGSVRVITYGGTATLEGFTYTGSLPYCAAWATYDDYYITNVKFGDIDNSSGAGLVGGYSDYTGMSTMLRKGPTLNTIEIRPAYFSPSYTGVAVFIDFNQDGDFDDEGEAFYRYNVNDDWWNNPVLRFNITVPADAITGNTRMRIKAWVAGWDGQTDGPCGNAADGEFEDYTLNIQPYPVPVITAFTPAQATGGQTVTIKGTGFVAITAVSFGGTSAASFTVVSDTLITAVVAMGSTGDVSVVNLVNSGSLPGFTFIPNAVPVITSFTPTSADQGAVITIKGSGFAYASEVWFGAKAAASFTVISDTEITATLAQGSTGSVRVITYGGTATLEGFTYTGSLAYCAAWASNDNEYITDIINVKFGDIDNSSGAGLVGGYSDYTSMSTMLRKGSTLNTIEIRPGLFTSQSYHGVAVFIDFNQDGDFDEEGEAFYGYSLNDQWWDNPILSFNITVPADAITGNTRMRIKGWQGETGGACGNANGGEFEDYTVNIQPYTAPVTRYFTPAQAVSGQTVTITGTSLANLTGVSFGGVAATAVTVVNDSLINAVVGAGASGDVSVTNPLGTASLAGFTYPAPVISAFTPATATGNQKVSITGTYLTAATAVSFGGVPANSFTVVSDSEITAHVGLGSTGSVTVTTAGGTATAEGFTFTANPVPSITSFTPNFASPGDQVTIKGTGLAGATSVSFGGTAAASFNVISDTEVTAIVDQGASGDVSVQTPGGTAFIGGFTFYNPTGYCIVQAIYAALPITGVSLNTLHNTTTEYDSYKNFGAQYSTTLAPGTTYSMQVDIQQIGSFEIEHKLAVFIDLNQDGAFDGEGETFYQSGLKDGANWDGFNFDITIPPSALTGLTRMRAKLYDNSDWQNDDPCSGSFEFGQVSDYTIDIENPLAPVITLFTPVKAAKGSVVTITGNYLNAASTVSFGGVRAGTIISKTDTQIKAVVAGGASGDVSITNPYGTTTLPGFTYIPPTLVTVCTSALPYHWNGADYNATGNYTVNLTTADGQDSVADLQLTVLPSATSTSAATICQSALPYSWNGTNYTATGTYTYTTTSANGCDSVATLILTVNPSTHGTLDVTVCESAMPYMYHGEAYHAGAGTNIFHIPLLSAAGCDSDLTLVLHVIPSATSSKTVTVEAAALPYRWNGTDYNAPGTYIFTSTSAAGCDSTATLELVVLYNTVSTTPVTVCSTTLPFRWNGLDYNAAGSYTKHLFNKGGYDSAATLVLTVLQSTTSSIPVTVCSSALPYRWNSVNYNTTGSYTIHLANAAGCDSAATLVLTVTDNPTAAAAASAVPACYGSTKTIRANVKYGTAPYQYSINGTNYQDTNGFVVPAGAYSIMVRDAAGCTAVTGAITVTQPAAALTLTAATSGVSCGNNTITATAAGGYAGGYLYSLNSGTYQNSNVLTGVAFGTYTVHAKDANGCNISKTVVVSPLTVTAAAYTLQACYGSTKTIRASAQNGAAPYRYSIDGAHYQDSSSFLVPAGVYSITVKDAAGCTAVTNAITVTQPAAALTLNAIPGTVTCGTIIANAAGGYTAAYLYSLNGGAYQGSNTLTGTANGTNTVYAKDANGCIITKTVAITQLTATAVAPALQACYGSTKTIRATAKYGTAPYQYSVNGTNYQDTNGFVKPAGTYNITIRDAVGCTAVTGAITVTQPAAALQLTALHSNVSCNGGSDGSITITATGGFTSYLYSADNGATYQSSNRFTGLPAGTVSIRVKDANACTVAKTVTVTQPALPCASLNAPGSGPSSTTADLQGELKVKVYPNPTQVEFKMEITSGDVRQVVELRVMDILGKTVYQTRGSVYDMYQFGRTFAGGMYIAEVLNGKNIVRVKLVKAN